MKFKNRKKVIYGVRRQNYPSGRRENDKKRTQECLPVAGNVLFLD